MVVARHLRWIVLACLPILMFQSPAGVRAEEESEPQRILSLVEERIDDPIADCVVDYLSIRTSDESEGERSALVAVVLLGVWLGQQLVELVARTLSDHYFSVRVTSLATRLTPNSRRRNLSTSAVCHKR